MKYRVQLLLMMLAAVFFAVATGCKKDEGTDTGAEYMLVIENGATGIGLDENPAFTAYLVGAQGIVIPESISWSSSESAVATISTGGIITTVAAGVVYIKATATYKGKTYEATVPLAINSTSLFTVTPQAIIWTTGAGTIPLQTVYFGQASASYSFASSNSSIASVSGSGEVSFHSTGQCTITVTANIGGETYTYLVPVLVVGEPTVPLPVTRISVDPASAEMFRQETQQFTATAYNSGGQVSGISFTWSTSDASVATVDNNGLVTARSLGEVTIYAKAEGIIGQAEVVVNPDTFIVVEPFMATVQAGATQQFTAKTYKIDRNTRGVNLIANLPGLSWEVPTTGTGIFDIATITSTGLATVKSDATAGLGTVVIAYYPGQPTVVEGAALLNVAITEPGGCQCGNNNPDVDQITTTQNSLNINVISGPQQINATAVDVFGDPVTGAALVYCSDNLQVANVDFSGTVSGISPGTANITICVGNKKKVIPVTVSF